MWLAQDTIESRVPRLNVDTNQILAHTFSFGTLDYVVFLVIALATSVSSLVDKGTVRSIKLHHSWKEQLFCSAAGSVDEGTVLPIKNSDTHV